MTQSVFFFEPIFQEKIWGGKRLETYGYDLPSDKIGECWAISARPNESNRIRNGELAGRTLLSLWEEERPLFGDIEGTQFPLLVKLLDATDDLSVQVHPDDAYAKARESGGLGKTECWYILDCPEQATLIYGIQAKTREALRSLLEQNDWANLLRHRPIARGDFLYVPSGTVHALTAGVMVLEIQQNSDTTYRLYDYDRVDARGMLRPLHRRQALDVITVPFEDPTQPPLQEMIAGWQKTLFLERPFTVTRYARKTGEAPCSIGKDARFLLFSVIEGAGELEVDGEAYPLKKGDHGMLSAAVRTFSLNGSLEIFTAGMPQEANR